MSGLSEVTLAFLEPGLHFLAIATSRSPISCLDSSLVFTAPPFPKSDAVIKGLAIRATEVSRARGASGSPRIEAIDEWAHRACLRMADVTVMHSEITITAGLIAISCFRSSILCAWTSSSGSDCSSRLCGSRW